MKKLTAILCAVALVAATCVTSFAQVSIGTATKPANDGKMTNVSAIGITLPAEGIAATQAKATNYPDGSVEKTFVEAFETEKDLAAVLAKVEFTEPLTTEGGKTVDPAKITLLMGPLEFTNAVTGEKLQGDGKIKGTLPGNENTKGKTSEEMAIVQIGSVHVVDVTADTKANTITAIYPCNGPFIVVGL